MCFEKQQVMVQQKGFVLVMAIIILAVLTLLGVSSMNSANIELKATANARQHQEAFNAALTTVEYSISKPVVTAAIINYQTNDPADFPINITPSNGDLNLSNISNQSVSVTLVGCGIAVGNSLEAGRGFSSSYFAVNGVASNLEGTASASIVQGVRYPAAGCT